MEAEKEKPTKASDILDESTLKDLHMIRVMEHVCGMMAAVADLNINRFGDIRLHRVILVNTDSDFIPRS